MTSSVKTNGHNLANSETGPNKISGAPPKDPDKSGIQSGNGVLLPQKTPATSMQFRPGDKTTYLLGTVAGDVLLCRTFERERCTGVFRGHKALVTAVCWRRSGEESSSVFLSAALDETIRVWHMDKDMPLCVLKLQQTLPGGYVDACWCPWYANLVAGVHGGGLDLWDISLSTHTPVLTHAVQGATAVAFSPHTRNVIIGDSDGKLKVIHMEGLEESANTFFKYATGFSKMAKLGLKPMIGAAR
ncbi:unnamed protein product [Meganyctiphanes norvegica]|uniref:Uncharacterized protein n=1 Tax=Meganyctiphanes norvegica TaxID=48144 RepID=A0AAV2RQ03_MEGNR